ncbi:MAG TPA: hypothetical protein PLU10_04010 [Chitinophagaceae bacterium]|nr:hypothetical protein [Chitinophagaceae bacterium]
MKLKIYNTLLLLTSLFGYLQWGRDQHLFLFQAELDIFKKLLSNPLSVLHPFILLPFAGQIILCITLFQKKPSALLMYIAMLALGLLLGFMLLIGLLILNTKIIVCALPFLFITVLTIRELRMQRKRN